MPEWYHLSRSSNGMCIVSSQERYDVERGIWAPKIPPEERSHGETRTKRLSISPTVTQCLNAIPDDDIVLYIYKIEVRDPVIPNVMGRIADQHLTGECWICDDTVIRNGGRIELACIGFIEVCPCIKLSLNVLTGQHGFPDAETEQREIFAREGREWLFLPKNKFFIHDARDPQFAEQPYFDVLDNCPH